MPLQKNWGRAGPWSHLQPGEDPKAQRGQSFAQSPTEYHQKLETGVRPPAPSLTQENTNSRNPGGSCSDSKGLKTRLAVESQ